MGGGGGNILMNSFTVMFLIDRDGMGIRCRHGIINALFVATLNALSIGQTNLGPSEWWRDISRSKRLEGLSERRVKCNKSISDKGSKPFACKSKLAFLHLSVHVQSQWTWKTGQNLKDTQCFRKLNGLRRDLEQMYYSSPCSLYYFFVASRAIIIHA